MIDLVPALNRPMAQGVCGGGLWGGGGWGWGGGLHALGHGVAQNCYDPLRSLADRIESAEVSDVEAHLVDIGQPRFAVAKGPVA